MKYFVPFNKQIVDGKKWAKLDQKESNSTLIVFILIGVSFRPFLFVTKYTVDS
jgi:hypothetical protein